MTTIAQIAARHQRVTDIPAVPFAFCQQCAQPWPCDASRLAALLTPERLAEALRVTGVSTYSREEAETLSRAILAALKEGQ